ncbi:hypothetical protein MCAP1_002010 [Malassezia caprae]|uniref:Uncharacterized protein n=1 Tax=Malassezia caprae TaxID=1381934 RepID=A0AAF0E7N8_9BASI|nr:hypothetical protein MCAP1_002010 [Malassezia caprae]
MMDQALHGADSAISASDRWSFVMGCQIQENYALKSTEGLSIWFILIWLGGDAFNLLGGLLQEVLLTMYYKDGKPIAQQDAEAVTESTPLVHTHNSPVYTATRIPARLAERFEDMLNYFTPYQVALIKYVFITLFVFIVGVAAYFAADAYPTVLSATDKMWTSKKESRQDWHLRWDAQLLGWLSAILYLSSRIPQIFKNRHTKCAGLSLALFIFAVGGNMTYVLSILLKDVSWPYLVENMSWIMGSVGTIFLDFIVLYQFIKYAPERRRIESNYPHHL